MSKFGVFCSCSGDHRELHVLTHSVPTRRSSELSCPIPVARTASQVLRDAYRPRHLSRWTRTLPRKVDPDPTRGLWLVERLACLAPYQRSEEHTSELQSLMRTSYAVSCLKKNNTSHTHIAVTMLSYTNLTQ